MEGQNPLVSYSFLALSIHNLMQLLKQAFWKIHLFSLATGG